MIDFEIGWPFKKILILRQETIKVYTIFKTKIKLAIYWRAEMFTTDDDKGIISLTHKRSLKSQRVKKGQRHLWWKMDIGA